MNYKFKAQKFEGPLDLLLHLIKKDNIDIFDINISEIADQYLKYIQSMENLNLNVDSEYLVMACELIELKSRELLPRNEEEEEEEDPKLNLINRLVEYQKYKDVSHELKLFERERKEYFTKSVSLLDEYRDDKVRISENISLDDLLKAFLRFQEKKEFQKPLKTVVTKKEYSVHKRSLEIIDKLKVKGKVKFEDLFDFYNKSYVVVTFLSILDLARDGNLIIHQDDNDSIILTVRGDG